MNRSVYVGVITILLVTSIYASSFTSDVSNAVPESSEIECRDSGSFSMCCQEKWDGEIIDSWIKTCTSCDADGFCHTDTCNHLGHCTSSNSNPVGPASTSSQINDTQR